MVKMKSEIHFTTKRGEQDNEGGQNFVKLVQISAQT